MLMRLAVGDGDVSADPSKTFQVRPRRKRTQSTSWRRAGGEVPGLP